VKVGDLVRRLSVPLRVGVVVDVDEAFAIVFYTHENKGRWVSFDLLEVINENR
jgi:hypothetical protein